MSVPLKATPTTFPHVLRFDGVDDVVAATGVNLTNVHSLRTKIAVLSQSSDHTGILFAANGIEMLLSDTRQIEVFGSAFITVGPVMNIGEFYDVCVTRNGAETNGYKVYVDGVLVGSTTRTDTSTGTNLVIGQKGTSASPLLPSNILVSDTCVWNRVLTSVEIQNLYYNNVVPQDGLIANYDRISDAGTLLLDSVAGNNGTITGATRLTSLFGIPKPRATIVPYVGALSGDGVNDFVQLAKIPISGNNASVTVHGTVTTKELGVERRFIVKAYGRADGGRAGTLLQSTGNRYQFTYPTGNTTTGGVTSNYPVINGETVHLTGVFNNQLGYAALYVNGMLDVYVATTPNITITPSTSPAYLFTELNTGSPAYSRSNIFQARIYERALTTAEIETLVTHNVTPYDTDPTICKLNLETTAGQVDGAVWYDKTANKNNGTISGAVLV